MHVAMPCVLVFPCDESKSAQTISVMPGGDAVGIREGHAQMRGDDCKLR